MAKTPPQKVKGCEHCKHRQGDFFTDVEVKEVTRCFCKARFTAVDAALMTQFCDFFEKNPDYKPPQKPSSGI